MSDSTPPNLDSAPEESMADIQDTARWRFTQWVQTGVNSWQQLEARCWRVPSEIKDARYQTCQSCEHFIKATTQCRQCLCFMGIKTWLGGFSCPEEKWLEETPPE